MKLRIKKDWRGRLELNQLNGISSPAPSRSASPSQHEGDVSASPSTNCAFGIDITIRFV